jgi:hypothetical protein
MAIQVVRARERGPSTANQFAQAFGNAVGGIGSAFMENRAERLKSANLLKEKKEAEERELSGKGRLLEKEYGLKGNLEEIKNAPNKAKQLEKTSSLEGARETLDRMRKIRQKNNLGIGSGFLGVFSPETRKDRGEYEQLGKSLIQYATNIPIRNKLEFETLAERLYDATVSDDEAEGILKAMERIIENAMNPYKELEGGRQENTSSSNQGMQKKPPLTSFMR